jgi:hypothetical protein
MKTFSKPCLISYILIYFLVSLLNPVCEGHNVIFKNVGQMAGTISYQHVKLALNISSIFQQFEAYSAALQTILRNLTAGVLHLPGSGLWYQTHLGKIISKAHRLNLQTVSLHIKEAQEISDSISTLQNILPEVEASNPDHLRHRTSRSASVLQQLRKKAESTEKILSVAAQAVGIFTGGTGRLLGILGLPFGIYRTYLGLYNKEQIEEVRKELYCTIDTHNCLVEVVEPHEKMISEINNQIDQIVDVLHLSILQNPGYNLARLTHLENQFKHCLNIANHTIQQPQHHRLAINFLSAVSFSSDNHPIFSNWRAPTSSIGRSFIYFCMFQWFLLTPCYTFSSFIRFPSHSLDRMFLFLTLTTTFWPFPKVSIATWPSFPPLT